jgi:hypothetical protein
MARYNSPDGLISEEVEAWSSRMERTNSSVVRYRLSSDGGRSGLLPDCDKRRTSVSRSRRVPIARIRHAVDTVDICGSGAGYGACSEAPESPVCSGLLGAKMGHTMK